jgi:hypothetical protein
MPQPLKLLSGRTARSRFRRGRCVVVDRYAEAWSEALANAGEKTRESAVRREWSQNGSNAKSASPDVRSFERRVSGCGDRLLRVGTVRSPARRERPQVQAQTGITHSPQRRWLPLVG